MRPDQTVPLPPDSAPWRVGCELRLTKELFGVEVDLGGRALDDGREVSGERRLREASFTDVLVGEVANEGLSSVMVNLPLVPRDTLRPPR